METFRCFLSFLLKAQLGKFFNDLPFISIFPTGHCQHSAAIGGRWGFKVKSRFELVLCRMRNGLDLVIFVEEDPDILSTTNWWNMLKPNHTRCRGIKSRSLMHGMGNELEWWKMKMNGKMNGKMNEKMVEDGWWMGKWWMIWWWKWWMKKWIWWMENDVVKMKERTYPHAHPTTHGTQATVKVLWQFYLFALDLYHVAILSHCLRICCLKYLKCRSLGISWFHRPSQVSHLCTLLLSTVIEASGAGTNCYYRSVLVGKSRPISSVTRTQPWSCGSSARWNPWLKLLWLNHGL